MRYRLTNDDARFLTGLTLQVDGAAVRELRIGVSRVREPKAWQHLAWRLERDGPQLHVHFERPDNWAVVGIDLVCEGGDPQPRAQLHALQPEDEASVRQRLAGARIAFLGTARNCGAAFAPAIDKLRALGGLFAHHEIHVFENDSTDATGSQLAQFARDGLVHAMQDQGVDAVMPRRTERLAWARNRLLDQVLARGPWDYIAWADLDGLVGARFSEAGFLSNFALEPVWDAVFPLTWPLYYDIWALREDHICPGDYVADGRHTLNAVLAEGKEIHAATQILAPQRVKGWVPVKSAFAGFGLYKAGTARLGRYVGLIDGEEVCEHVPYHAQLVAGGARLWLNPQCLTHIV
ncbi:MAG: hypothetical protein RIQ53_3427 [Pseudomonadota bacterium]|jgi:hypothetical protein